MKRSLTALFILLTMIMFAASAYAVCTPGANWTASWSDQYGETTYTLTAPCKVYIGIPFNINATASDSAYPNSSVAFPWSMHDAYNPGSGLINDTIAGGGWLTLSGGAWQDIISRTYTGTPYDHTISFSANDLGHGTGAHGFTHQVIGSITVDPFFVEAGIDRAVSAGHLGTATIVGTAIGPSLSYRWLEGDSVLQGFRAVDASGNAPLYLSAYMTAGSHTFALEVTDGSHTITDSVGVTITPASKALDKWNWRNPAPQGNKLLAVTSGDGIYVAVGGWGTLITSTSGASWSVIDTGTSSHLNAIAYGGRKYVAVGDGGTILSSSNAKKWNLLYESTASDLRAVAYANGMFVAVGGNSAILTSADGISWKTRFTGFSDTLYGVTYGGGMFMAVGDAIYTSPDGISWSRQDAMTTLRSVAYGNGMFIAVGGGKLWYSSNAQDWSEVDFNLDLSAIIFGGGTFSALGTNLSGEPANIMFEDFQMFWYRGLTVRLNSISYDPKRYVAVGEHGAISIFAGTGSWTSVKRSVTADNLSAVTFGGGKYIAIGNAGNSGPMETFSSTDGKSWTRTATNINAHANAIAYMQNRYVVAADNGEVALSSPLGWTAVYATEACDFRGLAYGNGLIVATGGYQGQACIETSADGQRWTHRTTTGPELYEIAYGGGAFVAVGDDIGETGGNIQLSADATSWTRIATHIPGDLRGIAYGGGMFVAVGDVILTSPDGSVWARSDYEPQLMLRAVAYANGVFVATGDGGVIVTSKDGLSWTQRASGTDALYGVAAGGGKFIAVGENGAILQSD